MKLLRYGNICNAFSKLVVGLSSSDKTNENVERYMRAMEKEMADLKRSEALKRKKKGKETTTSNIASDAPDDVPMEQDPTIVLNRKSRDPLITTRKGRPGSKRKKGGLELQKPKPTTCSVCNESVHDVRTCKVRLANPEMYPILSLLQ
jgi:hypothetical protein